MGWFDEGPSAWGKDKSKPDDKEADEEEPSFAEKIGWGKSPKKAKKKSSWF